MSYRQYRDLQNLMYTQNTRNNNKLPQSILYNNITPRKQSYDITRNLNPSFQPRQLNQDIIQLIAKIRCLQDDLLHQRFKNQSLQHSQQQYQKIIDNMQYQLTSQNYKIQKYLHEIELSHQKNQEILKYQENLKFIGEEIQELNNVLVKKNVQYEQIVQKLNSKDYENKKLSEEINLLKVTVNMYWKQLNSIIQEYTFSNNVSNKINYQKQTNQFNPHSFNQSLSFPFLSTQQLSKRFQLIRTTLNHYLSTSSSLQQQHQKQKASLILQLAKHKQTQIKLQYQLKLSQQRNKDQTKKQNLINLCYNDKKAQQIIEELLKKQDEYMVKIQEQQIQIQQLNSSIQQSQQTTQFTHKIQLQQYQSIIKKMKKQNCILELNVKELNQKISFIENKYQSIIISNQSKQSKQIQNDFNVNKKIRKLEEQNHQYQIKIEDLIGEITLLHKELQIIKADEQQQQQE